MQQTNVLIVHSMQMCTCAHLHHAHVYAPHWLQLSPVHILTPLDPNCVMQIAPPAGSSVVSQPAPDQPVVLSMSVLIDHASNMPTEKTSLGQLSIFDNPDQMAQLISAIESRANMDNAVTASDDGEAKLQLGGSGTEVLKAKPAKLKKDSDIVAVTYVRPWVDQDSQQLWA